MNKPCALRIVAIKQYLQGNSIEETASKFGVHPTSIRRWILWYKKGGEENLKRHRRYRTSWNRTSHKIEQKVVFVKQREPCLTLLKTQSMLNLDYRIAVPMTTIWIIWQRYGLTGFGKKKHIASFIERIPETSELRWGVTQAKALLDKGRIKEAARILNNLPITKGNLLERIPDKYLSLHRRLEKLQFLFGRIPYTESRNKAYALRKKAEAKGFLYLALWAGIAEAVALQWLGKPELQLELAHLLLKRLLNKFPSQKPRVDPSIYFTLLVLEGIAYTRLLRFKRAKGCVEKCRRFLYSHPYPSFFRDLATLYSALGYYKEAYISTEKALKLAENEREREIFHGKMAVYQVIAGEYRFIHRILKKSEQNIEGFRSQSALVRALSIFGEGKIEEAAELVRQAITASKKGEILNHLHVGTFLFSCIHAALNEPQKAKSFLSRLNPVLRKSHMKQDLLLRQIVLDEISHLSTDAQQMPFVRLALLLKKATESNKITDYRKAFSFASSKRILGMLHRLIFFFPRPVQRLIRKGKSPNLPAGLLKLPIFQKNAPVYFIKFLGQPRILRDGKPLTSLLHLKETTFFIHLSLRRSKSIPLESLCKNFWSRSESPKRNLYHILFSVRRKLSLPPNSLYIKRDRLNIKIYLRSDFDDYMDVLTQAKGLVLTGNWTAAKREYLRAFKLFRDGPFEKMYDNWSEHMRRVILNKLETEAIHFAESCLEHGNRADAKRVLEKVLKIIPQSEEIEKMVREYGGPAGVNTYPAVNTTGQAG
jgi:DNA-binding SARP family transcriptional activator/transposase